MTLTFNLFLNKVAQNNANVVSLLNNPIMSTLQQQPKSDYAQSTVNSLFAAAYRNRVSQRETLPKNAPDYVLASNTVANSNEWKVIHASPPAVKSVDITKEYSKRYRPILPKENKAPKEVEQVNISKDPITKASDEYTDTYDTVADLEQDDDTMNNAVLGSPDQDDEESARNYKRARKNYKDLKRLTDRKDKEVSDNYYNLFGTVSDNKVEEKNMDKNSHRHEAVPQESRLDLGNLYS